MVNNINILVVISLFMILANSSSSSISYVRSKMVNFRVALLLALSAIPALFIGYYIIHIIAPPVFDLLFSIMLVIIITYIVYSRTRKTDKKDEMKDSKKEDGPSKDKRDLKMQYSIPAAFMGGLASSLFGIGGGAILMPIQVGLLRMDIKKAIATSMFVIMIVTLIRVSISINELNWEWAIPLALGALLGAQIGSRIVKKVKGKYLLYILAVFLITIALYMGYSAISEMF